MEGAYKWIYSLAQEWSLWQFSGGIHRGASSLTLKVGESRQLDSLLKPQCS